MYDMVKLMLQKQCGDLNFLCCVGSLDKLQTLARLLDGCSTDEISFLWKYACSCNTVAGTTTPQPGVPGDDCVKNLRDKLCAEWITDAVSVAQLGLTAAAILANINPKLRKLIIGADAALGLLAVGCASQSLDLTVVHGACQIYEGLKEWKMVTGVVATVLAPALGLLGLLGAGTVGAALESCCSDPRVSSATLPSWAVGLDPRASNDVDTGLIVV